MSSGQKTLVYNTQERLLSTDPNRAQSFQQKAQAEIWRALLNTNAGTDDLDAAGNDIQTLLQTSPSSAEVLSGLVVRPQIGSTACLVDLGCVAMLDPDVAQSTDDSPYKIVFSAGLTALNPLVLTPNSSGSTRIDLIECSRSPGQVIETSSRDIYNTTSGLFAPVSVPKVVEDQLTFRIRLGTPGAGYPSPQQGWLPLAVASVPTSASNWDAVTVWDVRPIIQDREFAPLNLRRSRPRLVSSNWFASCNPPFDLRGFGTVGSANYYLQGRMEGFLNGRRVGGEFRRGTPGTDATNVNLFDSAHFDGSFSWATRGYVWLVFPFSLPRWARYTDATFGSRVPRSPRGIVVVSNVAPDATGAPASAIGLPASTGFVSATTTIAFFVCQPLYSSANTTAFPLAGTNTRISGLAADAIAPTSSSTTSSAYVLTAGTHFPTHAKRIHVSCSAVGQVSSGVGSYSSGECIRALYPNSSSDEYIPELRTASEFQAGGGFTMQANRWIELPPSGYPSGASYTITLVHFYALTGTGATVSTPALQVLGYEL